MPWCGPIFLLDLADLLDGEALAVRDVDVRKRSDRGMRGTTHRGIHSATRQLPAGGHPLRVRPRRDLAAVAEPELREDAR